MAVDPIKETIIAGLEQTFSPKMGLENLVFGNAVSTTYDTETIQADMFDGKRGAAKYTARKSKGQTVGLEGWTTVNIKPPLIDENFNISAQDLKVRNFGESNINQPLGGKFQAIVNTQTRRLQERKQRTYNSQITELMKAGTVTIVENDDKGNALASRTEDFMMPAAHIYTVPTAWNDNNANILQDMEDIDDLIVKDSGLVVTDAVVGKNTIMDMINNDKFMKVMDTRNYNFGQATREIREGGMIYWGNVGGRNIWEFKEFDESGNPLIPVNAYLPFAADAERDIYYGSIDAMVNGDPAIVEAEEVIYEITDEASVSKKFGFKSAKLYGLTQSAGHGHLTTR